MRRFHLNKFQEMRQTMNYAKVSEGSGNRIQVENTRGAIRRKRARCSGSTPIGNVPAFVLCDVELN